MKTELGKDLLSAAFGPAVVAQLRAYRIAQNPHLLTGQVPEIVRPGSIGRKTTAAGLAGRQ